MTRLYPRLLAARRGRGRRTLGAVLAAAALGGCGASGSGDVNQAVGDAAHAAQAVTQLSQTGDAVLVSRGGRRRRAPAHSGAGARLSAAGVERMAGRAQTQRLRPEKIAQGK